MKLQAFYSSNLREQNHSKMMTRKIISFFISFLVKNQKDLRRFNVGKDFGSFFFGKFWQIFLFGAVKLIINVDPDNHKYSVNSIGFNS